MNTRLTPALAAAVVATTLVAPQAGAAEAALTGGQLTWPIKQSFLKYIEGPIAGGSVTATDGAGYNRDATLLTFPLDVKDSKLDANGNGTLEFDGAIALKGHAGKLDINLDDFKVKVEGTKATITADYVTKGAMPGVDPTKPANGDDAIMATFDLDSAINPAQPTFKATQRPATFGAGAEGAFVMYKEGQTAKDAFAGLDLNFQNGQHGQNGQNGKGGTGDKQDAQSSSLEPGAIAGIVIGILAVLGALGAIGATAAGPLNNLLPF